MIPAKPTNLTVVNKTLDSALLHWSVSFPMQTFPPGLHHKVSYQNQWEEQDDWKVIYHVARYLSYIRWNPLIKVHY